MKGFIFRIVPVLLMLLPAVVYGEEPQPQRPQSSANQPSGRPASVLPAPPRSEWLGTFTGIVVSGRMQVKLVRNVVDEGPRIVYDTKGDYTTKFKAAIDKNGILKIEEPVDAKRTTVTEVTVWCNDIASLSVATADLTFDNVIARDMFDLTVTGGANVTAKLEVTDLSVVATGRSSIIIDGEAKYMTLDISTAKFDGSAFHTVSSIVDASHMAEVRLSVSERLQGTTSTSAKILYTGQPQILRARTTMFGGEIAPDENR